MWSLKTSYLYIILSCMDVTDFKLFPNIDLVFLITLNCSVISLGLSLCLFYICPLLIYSFGSFIVRTLLGNISLFWFNFIWIN